MAKEHRYRLEVAWTGNRGTGTSGYTAYGREHEIRAAGKPVLSGSSDPAFRGDPARWNPEELLVAYRQNWMGENFYTSNHVATFKTAGNAFKDWIQKQRDAGQRVLFFTTEHHTVAQLQRDLGKDAKLQPLTTREQNNKFVLLRAEL